MKADRLQIGVITGTHGVRGLVKVQPVTDDVQRFLELDEVDLVREGEEPQRMKVSSARLHKQHVLIGFEGYEDINLVEPMKGAALYVDRAQAVPLQENEYYFADLIGMRVMKTTEASPELLGELVEVMETGANDVFVVKREDGRELLIPSIRDCIRDVDVENGQMLVTLLPGMEEDA